jgi:hypothetical protein
MAARMAVTSACAVGSRFEVTWLLPVATISPSLAISAPNGAAVGHAGGGQLDGPGHPLTLEITADADIVHS